MGHEEGLHRANPRSSFVVCLWLAPLLSRTLSWLRKRFWNLFARAHARCMKPAWLHHKISHLLCSLAGPVNSFLTPQPVVCEKSFFRLPGKFGLCEFERPVGSFEKQGCADVSGWAQMLNLGVNKRFMNYSKAPLQSQLLYQKTWETWASFQSNNQSFCCV